MVPGEAVPKAAPAEGTACTEACQRGRAQLSGSGAEDLDAVREREDPGPRSLGGGQVTPQDRGDNGRVSTQGAAGSDLQVKIQARDGVGLTLAGDSGGKEVADGRGLPGTMGACGVCRMACGL